MHQLGQDDQRYNFLSLQEKVRSLKENSLTLNIMCGTKTFILSLNPG